MVHAMVLHVECFGSMNTGTKGSDGYTQGKNAGQSHPRQVPLNNGLRAMRLPEQRTLFRLFNLLIPHALAAVCEQSHPLN